MNPDFNFRILLKDELTARRKRNPAYSARAFARDLGLSASYLSQLLSGQRSLTLLRATTLVEKLSWSEEKCELFLAMVRYEQAPDDVSKAACLKDVALLREPEAHNLSVDEFHIISDWHHFALLELTSLADFRSDHEWIASSLNISCEEVNTAVTRLQRLGLLENRDGRYRRTKLNYKIGNVPSESIRQFHRGMLMKALTALDAQAVAERNFQGVTLAIDPAHLDEVRAMIGSFLRELAQFLASGNPKAVYHLGVQLFRVNQEAAHNVSLKKQA